MVFKIGQAIKIPCRVIDPATGLPATGQAVTYTLYDELDNVHVAAGACAEIATGDYVTPNITPDAAGTWKIDFDCAAMTYHEGFGFVVGIALEQDTQTGLEGGVNAVNRAIGREQVFATTIDLHQAAATYDLATATTQNCLVESLVFSSPVDLSDDAALTGITIQTDTTTVQTLIDAVLGAKANLTAEAQVAWVGSILLRATDKIRLTIVGGTATADPTTCPVVIKYRALVNGGYLA